MSHLSMEEITTLERQIDQLYDYKPIPEHEVKALCDKVSYSMKIGKKSRIKLKIIIAGEITNIYLYCRQKKFSQKNQTFSQCAAQLPSAETSTDNSTTSWNFSKSEANPQTPTTYSWETTLIVDTTQWRP